MATAISVVALPEMAQHYGVLATPYTAINETHYLQGRFTERGLLQALVDFESGYQNKD